MAQGDISASGGAGASLLGTGAALGGRWVSSAALDTRHGLPAGTVLRETGVQTRPTRAPGEDQITLGAAAARAALRDAGRQASDLDAILHAAAVPYQAIPGTAPLIQRALDLPDGALAAFDLNATCLSFLAALQHAAAMIELGRWHTVLIVSAEVATRGLDWRDPGTAGLFGDGAGAVVLGPGPKAVGEVQLRTYPSGYEASSLVAGGTRLDHETDPTAFEAHRRFTMNGRALFKLTRKAFLPFVETVLDTQGWSLADVDCVVPHQASPGALAQMAQALGVQDRVVDMAANHGNLIAASLPVALDHARKTGAAPPGARVLLLGTAAGVSFGAACVTL